MKKILLIAATIGIGTFSSCIKFEVDPGAVSTVYTFSDDFNNNFNDWNFSDNANDAYAVVSNGVLNFSYLQNGTAQYLAKDLYMNTYKNFEVQTKFASDNTMGLLIGYDGYSRTYGYTVTIEPNGYVALYDEGGNGYGNNITEVVPRRYSNNVNRNGAWNEVRFEQQYNRWVVYINGYEEFSVSSRNIKYGSVGFMVTGNTRGKADYLDVEYRK